ncbi:MAG: hypothetical protein LC797_18575 [Chloroflexi bacterium]|nr:hypothetical protein [Chloroflexota bacterium]
MSDLTFFHDPAVDRVLGVVMELAGELYVARNRLRTLEILLQQRGTLSVADLDSYRPSPEEHSQRLAERDAFIQRILRPMTAQAESPTPAFEPA